MLNIFDVGIILLFVMFIITGFKRGVIKELVALIGIIIVFIVSFSLKGIIGNFLCTILPFFKFSGSIAGITTINILLYQAIAFMIVFSILLSIYAFALKISKILQKLVNITIVLWLPSKLLGAIVSFVKGYIVLFAVFLVLMVPFKNQTLFNESTLINKILYKTPVLSKSVKNYTNAIAEIYDLATAINNQGLTVNNANLKTLDIMLKYKIIDKNTVTNLIKLHKLDTIKNIDQVIDKYN